jgi:hypothetical protein
LETYKHTQSAMLQIAVDIDNDDEALKKLSEESEAYGIYQNRISKSLVMIQKHLKQH